MCGLYGFLFKTQTLERSARRFTFVKVYMRDFFICLIKILMLISYGDGPKKFLIFFFPRRRRIKVSNFNSGWVQNRARRKTGDSRAVTSIQEHYSRDFFILQLFHSEYSIISFIFSSTTVFFLCTCKTTEE